MTRTEAVYYVRQHLISSHEGPYLGTESPLSYESYTGKGKALGFVRGQEYEAMVVRPPL